MAQSVKLSDEIMALVRRETELHSRSAAGQITHWVKIGRAIEHSESFDHGRITAALEGRLDTSRLREGEEEAWLDAFDDLVEKAETAEQPPKVEAAFPGRGTGLDADGNPIAAEDDTAA